ncbi:hypothetical protein XBJ1_1971 [Xenorhabdus bovienii SS-2004]|uniref:Uncharacterized protein n=1 Tax=Xenorhabdus bovienii (strain SS-2004) TaxID=406818 RepID=D3V2Y2_XENBS|nr:hypothetical protein XBJ1_1971 [Xenorhabdus bovienii SS-2004]
MTGKTFTQRTRVKRLNRKTISYSKSEELMGWDSTSAGARSLECRRRPRYFAGLCDRAFGR